MKTQKNYLRRLLPTESGKFRQRATCHRRARKCLAGCGAGSEPATKWPQQQYASKYSEVLI